MVTWKIKSCPRCGGDLFLDIDRSACFDHCLQCGYLGEKHAPERQEHPHDAGTATGSGSMTTDWARYENEGPKPGRPKGSKDKKKRRRKGGASYQSPILTDTPNGEDEDSVYPHYYPE